MTYTKSGSFAWAGGGKSGATVDLWAASRFAGPPAEDQAPPSGAPDAGPVVTGSSEGNPGAYILTGIAVAQDYYVRVQYGGHSYWGACPAGTLGGQGQLVQFNPTAQSGNYTAKPWDLVICTGAGPVITLPADPPLGTQVMIEQGGDGNITIEPASDASINGGFPSVISGNVNVQYYGAVTFTYVGSLLPNLSGRTNSWVMSSQAGTDGGYGLTLLKVLTTGATVTGTLAADGVLSAGPSTVSVNYANGPADLVVIATATLTLTLTDNANNQFLIVKNTSASGTVTFAAAAGLTLGSDVPATLAAGKGIWLFLDGTVWHTLTAAG